MEDMFYLSKKAVELEFSVDNLENKWYINICSQLLAQEDSNYIFKFSEPFSDFGNLKWRIKIKDKIQKTMMINSFFLYKIHKLSIMGYRYIFQMNNFNGIRKHNWFKVGIYSVLYKFRPFYIKINKFENII